ncbi:MAG TPA: thiamine pyrophosphate-dependent enzyme [Symbiobacteriaceae bacterium]|nr:thiamine pyrophosphate-dependent enzyme [Symbiobacteriaceae bacterium]
MSPVVTHYCPGCSHGVVHRLIAEVIDELGIRESTIGVASVGCSVLAYNYFETDFVQAPHGRAPAVATGVKRARPDQTVFTYQGDGDMAAIGTSEVIHAAVRGEKITAIMYNNTIYGMTGGQMSPTTLMGAVTATTPYGRGPEAGMPYRMAELLANTPGAAYVARTHVADVANIVKTKRAIKKAFEYQLKGLGFTMVEVMGNCPTNWGLSASESNGYVVDEMLKVFPLGELKDITKEVAAGVHA